MNGYELLITAAAAKELDTLPRKKDRQAVVARIRALAREPRPPGVVKLSGEEPLYRVRQGPYRIIYVIRIVDRKEAYRRARGTPRSQRRALPFGPRR